MPTGKRKVIEVFTNGDPVSRELVNRLFEMPLRNCIVLVRDVADGFFSRESVGVLIDGQPVPWREDGQVDTGMLEQALLEPAAASA